ncbi:MAG TPA: glycosyl hydrolase [Thermoanaerobaculia bacterium]|nr:glycosyl hydrolase [Thermoanaerobaculia bacterium]
MIRRSIRAAAVLVPARLVAAVLVLALLLAAPATQAAPPQAANRAGQAQAAPQTGKTSTAKSAGTKTVAEKAAAAKDDPFAAGTFAGLAFRPLGPAIASGRIGDLAVDPTDTRTWYVAVASGGVWKTDNAGTTWTPIFDDQGSYSIGTVVLDPNDPLTVWVGTGENNSQRSVGYGDGVYKSVDGGTTWKNVGLGKSEHIGKIVVDPRDSKVVYVAAQGPLWSSGGDRGLFKTVDGGTVWERVLHVSDDTGVTDVVMDPRNPDVLIAASYQRRRHVWTLIDGGPESALYKSTDAGATWRKLANGLPKEEMGRVGLAISPVDPNVVYAIVEAAGEDGGIYRSRDLGEKWEKRSDYVSGSPQYYQELVADPTDADVVYSMDTFLMRTEDGGATWTNVQGEAMHVDNHALWIDPEDPSHLVAGTDGGVYESFDRSATWRFFDNLPVTQFYKVALDASEPFYYVYGGTQDNNTLGGPSRTRSQHGILNREWFVTVGGDGFETQVDPTNPSIVYSQYQYGGLVRYDRRSGETVDIQPQPPVGDPPLRWNWSSPLLVSPHAPTRIYYAAQRLFVSDDRGDSWRPVSGDLTRQLDRNKLEVMGRIWSVDAVAKNASTSFYGNIVSLAESPLVEGLLYVGTDDGLVQVSEDGGATWRKVDRFPGVPELAYVADLDASVTDPDTVFAAFDNHKQGDFRPYLLVSRDRGRTWRSVAGDLPERGTVYSFAQDDVAPELWFAGTEFGVWFTPNGGARWIELTGNLPTIAVYDLELHRGEDDLVLATFGRGFYVLDDYSPLRDVSAETLKADALLPVPDAPIYVETYELGFPGKAFQGSTLYAAPNPPSGAVFTYRLAEGAKTLRDQRREREKKVVEQGEPADPVAGGLAYPSWEDLRAEDREADPVAILTVRDDEGNVVRRITGPLQGGYHRVAWDLRYPAADPVSIAPPGRMAPWQSAPRGPLAAPGTYTVELTRLVRGVEAPIGEPQTFRAVPLDLNTLPARDRAALVAFQRRTARLQRAVLGAVRSVGEAQNRLDHLEAAWLATPGADSTLRDRVAQLEDRLDPLRRELTGDPVIRRRNEPTPAAIAEMVQRVVDGHWASTSEVTQTHRQSYERAAAELARVLPALTDLLTDLAALEGDFEAVGAPWTPGRVPRWQPE